MLKQLLQTKKRLSSKDPYGASSKRLSFVASWRGKKFKLRQCLSNKDAKDLADRIAPISHFKFVPKVLHVEEEWVVFKYYKASEVPRIANKSFWYAIGTNLANLEATSSAVADPRFTQEFPPISNLTQFLEKANYELLSLKLINQQIGNKILDAIGSVSNNYCYGYLDLLAGNVLWDGKTTILADEEGFARTIKGLSFVRPLDIWHQYKPGSGLNTIERSWVFEAYSQNGGDVAFIVENEEKLRRIYYLLKTYDSIRSTGTSSESLKRLKT